MLIKIFSIPGHLDIIKKIIIGVLSGNPPPPGLLGCKSKVRISVFLKERTPTKIDLRTFCFIQLFDSMHPEVLQAHQKSEKGSISRLNKLWGQINIDGMYQ